MARTAERVQPCKGFHQDSTEMITKYTFLTQGFVFFSGMSCFPPTGGTVGVALLFLLTTLVIKSSFLSHADSVFLTTCDFCDLWRKKKGKTAHFHIQVSTVPLILCCCLCSAVTFLPPPLSLSLPTHSLSPSLLLLLHYSLILRCPSLSSSSRVSVSLAHRITAGLFLLYDCAFWVFALCCVWLKSQVSCGLCSVNYCSRQFTNVYNIYGMRLAYRPCWCPSAWRSSLSSSQASTRPQASSSLRTPSYRLPTWGHKWGHVIND